MILWIIDNCLFEYFDLQMSEQFNQELSLTGKIPSGLFNAMFEFSGSWQKDASSTKTLAFEGMFISLYTIALEKSNILLCDHVKEAVPSSWEPALLARSDSYIVHAAFPVIESINSYFVLLPLCLML